MAQIKEEIIAVKISRLVRDGVGEIEPVVSEHNVSELENTIRDHLINTDCCDNSAIVELELLGDEDGGE